MNRLFSKSFQRLNLVRPSIGLQNRFIAVNRDLIDWRLYAVADEEVATKYNRTLESVVSDALNGGATVVQLRAKRLSTPSFSKRARKIKNIIDDYNQKNDKFVPFIVNDNIDVALTVDADGVHIGQSDSDPLTVRTKIGLDKLLGVTVGNVAHVQKLMRKPYPQIDYFGTDAVFPTPSKQFHDDNTPMEALGTSGLSQLVRQIRDEYNEKYPIPPPPVIAIGGIDLTNVDQVLQAANVDGIAVISAITGADNPLMATRSLRTIIDRQFAHKHQAKIPKRTKRTADQLRDDIVNLFLQIKEKKPLIHHITNFVVMNQTANATLNMGASPIMSHAIEEVEEMVSLCDALLLNPGTLSSHWIRAMTLAGMRANSINKPIILDPVGAGATSFRTRSYQIFLKELDIQIIKGNSSEIGSLYGDMSVETRGVDSVKGVSDPARVVKELSIRYNGAVVAVTGHTDYISDGTSVATIENQSDRLKGLTGMGCTASALTACFAGATDNDYFAAAIGGIAVMGVCAELAEKDPNVNGPASFNVALFDRIANLTPEQLRQLMKIRVL